MEELYSSFSRFLTAIMLSCLVLPSIARKAGKAFEYDGFFEL